MRVVQGLGNFVHVHPLHSFSLKIRPGVGRATGSALLRHQVDRVARDLHHQVLVADQSLTAQARVRLQAPGLVQVVVFLFLGGLEGVEALAHDNVAGGTGARLLAGVFDFDAVAQRVVEDAHPGLGLDLGALWADLGVRKKGDLRHYLSNSSRRWPARAFLMPLSMRRAANSALAALSASTRRVMSSASS